MQANNVHNHFTVSYFSLSSLKRKPTPRIPKVRYTDECLSADTREKQRWCIFIAGLSDNNASTLFFYGKYRACLNFSFNFQALREKLHNMITFEFKQLEKLVTKMTCWLLHMFWNTRHVALLCYVLDSWKKNTQKYELCTLRNRIIRLTSSNFCSWSTNCFRLETICMFLEKYQFSSWPLHTLTLRESFLWSTVVSLDMFFLFLIEKHHTVFNDIGIHKTYVSFWLESSSQFTTY